MKEREVGLGGRFRLEEGKGRSIDFLILELQGWSGVSLSRNPGGKKTPGGKGMERKKGKDSGRRGRSVSAS